MLDRQRGASEFEAVKESFLSFDDAVRDAAWDRDSSRSARFTIDYGELRLFSNALRLFVDVPDYENASYSTTTGYVAYFLSTQYVTMGDGYRSYILGSNRTITTENTGSLGRVCIEQASNRINTTLTYGVRALEIYTISMNQSGTLVPVSYVDIWIIRVRISQTYSYVHDFNLVARSPNITALSFGGSGGYGYPVIGHQCTLDVTLGSNSDSVIIPLDGDRVVFNFLISEVNVST